MWDVFILYYATNCTSMDDLKKARYARICQDMPLIAWLPANTRCESRLPNSSSSPENAADSERFKALKEELPKIQDSKTRDSKGRKYLT
ncbi:hypothetical protein Trco_001836 [Trichoderma cornu-damae]|uniref:Uncharacterized protein n=1 Tax=Trichoderma cornu-damae TaxID=654480 RepID=A0A9P8QRN8_9HYPO|nr:hypothetical protein Trco_001836 [Trichoderma cornu-damae]